MASVGSPGTQLPEQGEVPNSQRLGPDCDGINRLGPLGEGDQMRPQHTTYLRLGIPLLDSVNKREAKARIAHLIQVEYDYSHSYVRLTSPVLALHSRTCQC